MPDVNQTATLDAKGTLRALKLHRETLRELDAGELGTGFTRKGLECGTQHNCATAHKCA